MPAISALSDPATAAYVSKAKLTAAELNSSLNALRTGVVDLNDVVADLQKNFASASAPSDLVNGGLWYDSTNNVWKGRRSAAWVQMLSEVENGAAWPSFSVHKDGSNQVGVGTALEIITWSTELFDTNADFAANRFTPTVAGKYLLTANLEFLTTGLGDGDRLEVSIYKNGAELHTSRNNASGTTSQDVGMSWVVDANGSTDYFEVFGNDADGANDIVGTATKTYFMGSRIA